MDNAGAPVKARDPQGHDQFHTNPFASQFLDTSTLTTSSTTTSTTTTLTSTATPSNDAVSTSIPLGVSTTATLNEPSTAITTTSSTVDDSNAGYTTLSLGSTTIILASSPSSSQTSSDPTTLDTSTSSPTSPPSTTSTTSSQAADLTSTAPDAAASAGMSTSPLTISNHSHHDGLSSGALAAAVIVPLLFLLFGLLLAFFWLRRRSRASQGARPRDTDVATHEKPAVDSHPPIPPMIAAPVMTSNRNNAYFTGLDTSSHTSEQDRAGEFYNPDSRESERGASTFSEPPPPYKAKSSLKSAPSGEGLQPSSPAPHPPTNASANPALITPAIIAGHESSDEDDDQSPTPRAPSPNTHLTAPRTDDTRPSLSRSSTNRSITSTLYSDTASVHSAQAARVSVVDPLHLHRDPFRDPTADSPVEEWHSVDGSQRLSQ